MPIRAYSGQSEALRFPSLYRRIVSLRRQAISRTTEVSSELGIEALLTFLGGIGLFLLGMRMMTDGLKMAAGSTLRGILVSATRSRLRGLASGVLITTMVQSSSAVIFATIGFVNAGLMTLAQAIGVIYGSNLGTTLTSWVVALIGFNVNLQALSLPAIGLGMALWVTMGVRRYGALGQAVAGFGLFFLGIDVLRDTFAGTGDVQLLATWADLGAWSLVLFLGAGFILTVLMQSSSAALAVTLTAAAGGLIPFESAAVMVIGANVGTTSTALFAIIGATSAAKRAALAHVAFNVITAAAAIAILPVLLWLVELIAGGIRLEKQPATLLAIFHTMTKLLGIFIMWPLTGLMVRQLQRMFISPLETTGKPQYLDRNIQATPSLALEAVHRELTRMGEIARQSARTALSTEYKSDSTLQETADSMDQLSLAVSEFTSGIYRPEHEHLLCEALPIALRVAQYYDSVAELSAEMEGMMPGSSIDSPALANSVHELKRTAVGTLNKLEAPGVDVEEQRAEFEKAYQHTKNQLLLGGARREIQSSRLASVLEQLSTLHRLIRHVSKGADYLEQYQRLIRGSHPADKELNEDVREESMEASGHSAEGAEKPLQSQ